ncbi:MAG: cupin domain-containing protein [Geminicoccaceae bacterium]
MKQGPQGRRFAHPWKERHHENPAQQRPAVREGAGRVFHRLGAYRQLLRGARPGPAAAAVVTFEPGARTAWHTHPLGQRLPVTAGEGWVQKEGEPKQLVRPGDTVWFEPGEKHWHGATDRKAMTHVAVQEAQDGSPVEWLEHVSDADYAG